MSLWHCSSSDRGTSWQQGDGDSKALLRAKEKGTLQSGTEFGVKMARSALPARERLWSKGQSSDVPVFSSGSSPKGQSPAFLLLPYLGGASRDSLGLGSASKTFHKKILQIFGMLKAVEFTGITLCYREKRQKNGTKVLKSSGRRLKQANPSG